MYVYQELFLPFEDINSLTELCNYTFDNQIPMINTIILIPQDSKIIKYMDNNEDLFDTNIYLRQKKLIKNIFEEDYSKFNIDKKTEISILNEYYKCLDKSQINRKVVNLTVDDLLFEIDYYSQKNYIQLKSNLRHLIDLKENLNPQTLPQDLIEKQIKLPTHKERMKMYHSINRKFEERSH